MSLEIDLSIYDKEIKKAVRFFWDTRSNQKKKQKENHTSDQGNRGAVTGGKQMDGFIKLLTKICNDLSIPPECIYTKGNHLPGYFRPSKDWDFVVISPKNNLIAAIELKSQVGSFGNNFNNRTEEALGSAVDLWTAYKWEVYDRQMPPWVGYLVLLEKDDRSTSPVGVHEPYFKVRGEFKDTSYLERYDLFCSKLMMERHYSSACLIWSKSNYSYGNSSDETSVQAFLESFIAFLLSKKREFQP
jgi:hypothetical protein